VLAVNETEAAIICDAASLILDDGHTTWTAARTLNATDRRTRSGRPWHFRNLAFHSKSRTSPAPTPTTPPKALSPSRCPPSWNKTDSRHGVGEG